MTNKIIFVDLDDTVIDTSCFKQRFFSQLSEVSGVSLAEITSIYENNRKNIHQPEWLERFTAELSAITSISRKEVLNILQEILETTPVDKKLLNKLRETEANKVLFTYGNRVFQSLKITRLQLNDYFDHVVITSKDKAEHFAGMIQFLPGYEYVVIDDQRETLNKIKQSYPTVIALTKEEYYA